MFFTENSLDHYTGKKNKWGNNEEVETKRVIFGIVSHLSMCVFKEIHEVTCQSEVKFWLYLGYVKRTYSSACVYLKSVNRDT